MNENYRTTKMLLAAALLAIPGLASADRVGSTHVENVETLLDKPAVYENKMVSVSGEVKNRIDSRSFVLEGGGIINDEIVVIMNKNIPAAQTDVAVEDAEVTVTGKVVRSTAAQMKRDHAWDITPTVETTLGRATHYLVADNLVQKSK